jgi:hypothetical protein
MAKHKGEKIPRWAKKKPGKGKHGVDDVAAHKIGKKWDEGDQTKGTKKAT